MKKDILSLLGVDLQMALASIKNAIVQKPATTLLGPAVGVVCAGLLFASKKTLVGQLVELDVNGNVIATREIVKHIYTCFGTGNRVAQIITGVTLATAGAVAGNILMISRRKWQLVRIMIIKGGIAFPFYYPFSKTVTLLPCGSLVIIK